MGTRRRPGSWQDEVAKGFSRLFSRSSSQDKEDEAAGEEQEKSLSRLFFRSPSQEKTEKGPQEEQDRSPSRLFLRRVNQDSKAEHGAARGPQEEQERVRGGFSRLFSRTSSQEKQEEDHTKSQAGEEDRQEEKSTNVVSEIHEKLSQAEQVTEDQSSSPPPQVTSESEEEKDTESRQNSKVIDSEKQSRENFFHFIGNLFHFSPKTTLGNTKQVDSTQDLCKEHEDTQVKNNLDKEDSHQEHTQDISTSEVEQTAEFIPAPAEPSVESNNETPKETITEERQTTPTSRPKLNGFTQEAPSVTYGTYRGSRKIRKLLKKRPPDVNSPIPEKEEISEKETSSIGTDICTEDQHMINEIMNMEPVSCRSSEEEMPPSKIQIKMKMQPKIQAAPQNGEQNTQEVGIFVQDAEGKSVVSIPSQNGESDLNEDKDFKQNAGAESLVTVSNHNGDSNVHNAEDLKEKCEVISLEFAPTQKYESLSHEVKDLKENIEDTSSLLQMEEQNSVDNSSVLPDMKQSTESSKISNNEQLHADISVQLSLDCANDLEISKEFQPNLESNTDILTDPHLKAEPKLDCSMDPDSNVLISISSDLPPNEEKISSVSQNVQLDSGKSLDSSIDLHSTFDNKSKLSLNMSPQNISSNIAVDFSNSEQQSTMLNNLLPDNVQQNSGERSMICDDVHRKEDESFNIVQDLHTNCEVTSDNFGTLLPCKDESPKCEVGQNVGKCSEVADENVLHLQPARTQNTQNVNASENDFNLLSDLNLDSKESADILEKHQIIIENSSNTSSDLHFNKMDFGLSLQSSQVNNLSSLEADIPTDTGSKNEISEHHQSEEISEDKYLESAKEKFERLVSSVVSISESTVNDEQALVSDISSTQEEPLKPERELDNEQKLMKECVQTIYVGHLTGSEELQLNPQEKISILEQTQSKAELPKTTAVLQPYGSVEIGIQKDIHQNKDEYCKLEEATADLISEDTSDSAIQTAEVPHTGREIFMNDNSDLPTDTGSKKKLIGDQQSEEMSEDKYLKKAEENLERLVNSVVARSESTVNDEPALVSDISSTQEEPLNPESELDSQQKSIKECVQPIDVGHLSGSEELQLNSQEKISISEQTESKAELPKTTEVLERYGSLGMDIHKDLHQYKNENCKLEEATADLISEDTADSALQTTEVPHTEQEIVMNDNSDLPTDTGSKKELIGHHQSKEMSEDKYLEKAEENLERLVNSVVARSESTVNDEQALVSNKSLTQKESLNPESELDNQQKLIEECVQPIDVGDLRGPKKLQLSPQEKISISKQTQSKAEEFPKTTSVLQPYASVEMGIQKDLHQYKDENGKLEEATADLISEDMVGSAVKTNEVPHTEQEIVMDDNLPEKTSSQPSKQAESFIIETKVNEQPSLMVLKEPHAEENEFPVGLEQQQSKIETRDNILNEFTLTSSADDDTSGTIIVNDNAEDIKMPDMKPVAENILNNGLSCVTETARTVSFDNGIECRSPSPMMSGSPSSTDFTEIRCDSPLPLSDAIDSGMVSSQAYTPEEHLPVQIFSPEILNKAISDPFIFDQENKRSGHIESEHEHVENTLHVDTLPNFSGKKQNEPIAEETESWIKRSIVKHTSVVDTSVTDVSSRPSTNNIIKTSLNSDVYVAKVSVKSVNIEEVKLAPSELRSDIISVSKVESATFEKEIVRLPNFSPPPSEPESDNEFKDDIASIVTNTGVPSDTNEKELSVHNVKLSFHEPSLFLDINNYEEPPHSCYMNAEGFPSLNKIDVVENVVNMFSNDYAGDSIPQFFLEKGLPNKSPDVLIENLKNNNLTMDSSDDIINLSLQTNTSETELTNESLVSDDSHYESCDSSFELNPNDMTYKEPEMEKNLIFQADSAALKISLPSTEHSELSSELFEKKANEIIFSVLHSALDEFQNLNKNHISAPSLDSVKEISVENSQIVDGQSAEVEAASRLVNDVIYSATQILKNNFEKNIGTSNICTESMVSVNGPVENKKNSIDNSLLPNCHEVNSNVLPPTPTSDSVGVTEDCKGAPDILNGFRHLDKGSENEVSENDDKYSSVKVMIQDDTENKNVMFDLGVDGDQDGLYTKSFETEGSMNTPLLNSFLGENMCITETEFTDLFQFSLYNSKYVEIESDDEFTEEEPCDNEQTSNTDMFLTLPSRRVRIYPFSLSPIYEDDSSCEDDVSNISSPSHKEGTTTGSGSSGHTSILSLLQSVSDRLKEANIEEMSFGEKLASLSEAAPVSDLDNTDASEKHKDISAPNKSNLDSQKMLSEETTSGGKRSSLFITKAENKINKGSGRQSFLLNLSSQSTTKGLTSPTASTENHSSPSATSEPSTSNTKDLYPGAAPIAGLSPLQVVSDSGLSAPKPEMKCQPRMSSKSVYYQYFHASQNYSNDTENKESPAQEKVDLPTEKESKETEDQLMIKMDSMSLKLNPRPGKVILSDVTHHENKIELKGDVLDATSWVFPNGVNIRVIRGCWILYEKPHFEGQAHVLEEGEAVLLHLWDPPGASAKPDHISIGSVKRVVKDYLPEIVISPLEDTSDSPVYIHTEVPSLENLVDRRPRSLTVNSGVWLTYAEPQYNGTVCVVEEGCDMPQIQECGVKSMRPLKMGGLKVQLPNDPKIIIYEKPLFQGWSREITEHVFSIGKLSSDEDNTDPLDVGSIRVVGGIWVGYEKEQYKGYQYLLEEGDYEDWQAWGGYSNTLRSIRYLQANFLEASVTLVESDSEEAKQVDLFNQAIPDLELAGYHTRPQCIHVKKGLWVAYQQKHYCGEQYILEKGRYMSHVNWGGSSNTIMSIRPVLLEPLGRNEVKHLIKVYESTNFQGQSVDFTQQVSDFNSFVPKSLKVLRGCWVLCYQENARDNVCVLEEGHFPDLASCGCPAAEIKYFQPIDYVFAEPSISLFALDTCEGRELRFEESVTSVLSEDLHFYTQSVWIKRGLWIAYEGTNFLGRQMLLDPQQILNWSKFSGWKVIGSLRPLKQPAVYFMVRNRHRDKYLTVTGKLSDTRATFVSVSSRNGQSSQIWYFTRGFLKSKANDSCLDVVGGKNIPGSKVSLWAEHGKTRQKWKINKDGTISSYISDDLVLDIKGGNYYDQNYLVVNRAQESALTQKWDIEIL